MEYLSNKNNSDEGGNPLGWSYNPSSLIQRLPSIVLSLANLIIACFMAIYQLGYLDRQEQPTALSGLWILTLAITFFLALWGGTARWRTSPWLVLLFGILILPIGIASALLILCQPILIDAWCLWCLVIAFFQLFIAMFSVDEIIAALDLLARGQKLGKDSWNILWNGGSEGWEAEPKEIEQMVPKKGPITEMLRGVSVPWSLSISLLMGICLMLLTKLFNYSINFPPELDYFFGAWIITVSILAMAEVARAVRWLNLLNALGILFVSWLVWRDPFVNQWDNFIFSALLVILILMPCPIKEHYGDWEKHIY